MINEIGISNLRELTPVLKAIITGVEPKSNTAKESLGVILDEVDKTIEMSHEEVDEETRQKMAFEWALAAGLETNRTLRKTLRPEPPINAAILKRNGTSYLIAELDFQPDRSSS
jgi:hypothetical protein